MSLNPRIVALARELESRDRELRRVMERRRVGDPFPRAGIQDYLASNALLLALVEELEGEGDES